MPAITVAMITMNEEKAVGKVIDDIRAALKFAGKLIEQEQYHPLPGSS